MNKKNISNNNFDIYCELLKKNEFNLIKKWLLDSENIRKYHKRYKFNSLDIDNMNIHIKYLFGFILEKIIKVNSNLVFEWWINKNSKQGWHVDKDEDLYLLNKEIELSKRSFVFFVLKPKSGGDFQFLKKSHYKKELKKIKIPFQENKLISFPSYFPHKISEYKGDRISVAINLWNK